MASIFLGMGSHDVDHSADGDAGPSHAEGQGDSLGWLPITSLRFWTFFLGFGGLAGTALTYFTDSSRLVVALVAGGVGWLSGLGMVATMKKVKSGPGSELVLKELCGESAVVVVPVGPGSFGKVRIDAKGRVSDLIAETDEKQTFAIGTKVMIVGEGDEGRVQVASA